MTVTTAVKFREEVPAMIHAFPTADGRFRLTNDAYRSKETYYRKDEIKAAGGRWDGQQWTIPAEALPVLASANVVRMRRVRVAAHCHSVTEETIWIPQTDVDRGKVRLGCSQCDVRKVDGRDVDILEVMDEEPTP
jgi:hypothetical protein